MNTPPRAIGIDPGSVRTGWGIIEQHGNKLIHVASGTIAAGDGPFSGRLETIYADLCAVCRQYSPSSAGIEGIFHQKNAQSALKLGHARGVALLALAHCGLQVGEYEPTVVKKAVTGQGRADKIQVQTMIGLLLGRSAQGGFDESDALAIAVCHLHHLTLDTRIRR